jgi:hypothetical protein
MIETRYLIIPTTITGSLNYNQLLEYDTSTLRLSIDGTKTFVKYNINDVTASYTQSWYDPILHQSQSITIEAGVYGRPDIYSSGSEYTHEQILVILSNNEWILIPPTE